MIAVNLLLKKTSVVSRGCWRVADTSVVPKEKACFCGTYKGAPGNRTSISGHGLARRTWRNTPCEPRVYDPPNLANALSLPPILASRTPRTQAYLVG